MGDQRRSEREGGGGDYAGGEIGHGVSRNPADGFRDIERQVRKRLALGASLYQILQILSVTLFEKTPILQALQAADSENDSPDAGNQLILCDF